MEATVPPTHYKVAKLKENGLTNTNYILINFNKIIVDREMASQITKLCGDKYIGKGIKKFKNSDIVPMQRIEQVRDYFNTDNGLDPIKVMKYNDTKYSIIDGRHRYIMSLYNDYTHIPCNVLEEL